MTTTSPAPKAPVRALFFGALSETLFGYDSGIAGVALLSIKKTFPMGPALSGFVVSSLLLGAAVGVGVSGRLADRLGRRPALLIISAFFAAGGLVTAFAPHVWVLLVGRFVMGLGVGGSASAVTVYLVEVAPTRHRGKIGSLGQVMVVVGILSAYLVGYALQPHDAWRWMLGVSVFPALVLAIGLRTLPESPRWFVTQARYCEARAALVRLRDPDPDGELDALKRAYDEATRAARSVRQVLGEMFSPGARWNSAAAMLLALLVQFIGTNSIIYYAPTALVNAGLSTSAAVTANLSVGTVNVVFTLIGLALVDRMSRRGLLTLGVTGMTTAMVYLASVNLAAPAHSSLQGGLTLAGMLLFQASFSVSWGLLVRVVVSELFPSSIRGTATGLVLILNWLANFAVGQTFPSLLAISAALSFGIFAGVGILALIYIRLVLPETGAGHSLEEVAPRIALNTMAKQA